MKVEVCTGNACAGKFSKYIVERLKNDSEKFNYKNLEILETPCMGGCKKGPNVKINEGDKTNYAEPAKIGIHVYNQLKQKNAHL